MNRWLMAVGLLVLLATPARAELHLVVSDLGTYDAPSQAWIRGYVRSQFNDAYEMVQAFKEYNVGANQVDFGPITIPDTADQAWQQFAGQLEVTMYFDWSVPYPGGGRVAGYYDQRNHSAKGIANPAVSDVIVFSWFLESASWDLDANQYTEDGFHRYAGHYVLRHELQHFLATHCGIRNPGDFGHGTPDDMYFRLMNRVLQMDLGLDFFYHRDLKLAHD